MPKSNVMIFTKNANDFKQVIKFLDSYEFNVILKIESEDVSEAIKVSNPELIIIDSDEKNNGITLFEMIKDEGTFNRIPVIITGTENTDAKINALRLGAIDYVTKEFDSKELFYKIKNISNMSKNYVDNNIYDTLTGIYSDKYGTVLANKEFDRIKAKGGKINVFVIDIDNMAEINVIKGNDIGNKILKDCINIFNQYLASGDFIFRKSGDEFVLIFLNDDPTQVLEVGEKMQKQVVSLSEEYNVNLSFSGGISFYTKDANSFTELYEQATDKLKKAKRSGKQKICIKSSEVVNYKKCSLLFVDDDKIINSILTTRYKNKGYEIYSAYSGEEALKIFKDNHIDIIVTDFYMPGMAGDEFIKNIRHIDTEVKIIVLSGQKNEDFIKRALSFGADDYVTKPFSPVELDLRIRRFLR